MAYDIRKEDLDHFEDYYQGQWVDVLEKSLIENQISMQNKKNEEKQEKEKEKNKNKEIELKQTKSRANSLN